MNKYYFDWFNENVFAGGSARPRLGALERRRRDADRRRARQRQRAGRRLAAGVTRGLQSGYLYHYAFAMIIGSRRWSAGYVLRS